MVLTNRESQKSRKGFAGRNRASIEELKRRSGADTRRARDHGLTRAEERRLLSAARAGDARALGRLIDLLSGPIYRFGRGFCGNAQDAEDVTQVVLMALSRTLHDLRGDASLTTWAYTVARHACARQRRRRVHEPEELESLEGGTAGGRGVEIPHPTMDPHRDLERSELQRALQDAIAALPPPQREALVLRDVEGLPAGEVGRILGLGERAVKSRLHRARTALRQALAPFVEGEPRRRAGRATGVFEPRPRAAKRCPDVTRLVSRYLEDELDPAVCARLEGHLAACPNCGAACEALRTALHACSEWRREPLPVEIKEAVHRAIRLAVAAAPRNRPR